MEANKYAWGQGQLLNQRGEHMADISFGKLLCPCGSTNHGYETTDTAHIWRCRDCGYTLPLFPKEAEQLDVE